MKRLCDVLAPNDLRRLLVVECFYCEMTMTANSDDAFVTSDERQVVVCRSCGGTDEKEATLTFGRN